MFLSFKNCNNTKNVRSLWKKFVCSKKLILNISKKKSNIMEITKKIAL